MDNLTDPCNLKCEGTLPRTVTFIWKYCLPSHRRLLLKERICSSWEQILAFKSSSHWPIQFCDGSCPFRKGSHIYVKVSPYTNYAAKCKYSVFAQTFLSQYLEKLRLFREMVLHVYSPKFICKYL